MEMESKYNGHMNSVDNSYRLEIPSEPLTRRYLFKRLPLQKRLQAIENIRRYPSYFTLKERMDQENCITPLLFVYHETRQGHDYWMKIKKQYFL